MPPNNQHHRIGRACLGAWLTPSPFENGILNRQMQLRAGPALGLSHFPPGTIVSSLNSIHSIHPDPSYIKLNFLTPFEIA